MMVPKSYNLLDRCVEEGIQYGWARAHKHTDVPDEIWIREQIHQAVMNEICEWFEFKGADDEVEN
jgi:hypothetical protein